MWLVEGTVNGKNIIKQPWDAIGVSITNKTIAIEGNKKAKLENIISVDIVSQEVKTTTGGGVTGAGAGAVLGFLIAGPLGTAVGAGLGSKSKQQGRDNTTIAIGFKNGDAWICDGVKQTEIGKLKVALSQNLISGNKQEGTPKSDSVNKKKKVRQDEGLKKPKKPGDKWDLKKARGRKVTDTIKLPALGFLKKWENIEGCDSKSLELFKSNFASDLEDYNNFKWVYFNTRLESEGEFDQIALRIIKNLIAQSNELKSLEERILNRNLEEKRLEDELQIYNSKLEDCKKELSETGFFSKGEIKKKILSIEEEIKGIKSEIAANNKTRTSNQKRFDSKPLKIHRTINEPITQFELIYTKIFPKLDKSKKGLKVIEDNYENGYFLETYLLNFDEIWDKKIKEDKEKRKKEKQLEVNQAKKKEADEKERNFKAKKTLDGNKQTLSIQDRLTELQKLKDQDLITNEEFETSRKRILDSL